MTYLLDANVLIRVDADHYPLDRIPQFLSSDIFWRKILIPFDFQFLKGHYIRPLAGFGRRWMVAEPARRVAVRQGLVFPCVLRDVRCGFRGGVYRKGAVFHVRPSVR